MVGQIGSACGIIATLDPASIEYRQTMDELNFFARDQNLPQELRVSLRSYFRNTLCAACRASHPSARRAADRLRLNARRCVVLLAVRTTDQIRSKRYEGLLGRMSMKLRGDAAYRMCEFRLRQVCDGRPTPGQPRVRDRPRPT